jgi:hypothetical protein
MPRTTTPPAMAGATPRRPVTVLRWPEQEAERRRLAALGRPRVLLTPADVTPPSILDDQELWVRDGRGAIALLEAMEQLGGQRGVVPAHPVVDDDGVLRYDGRWVDIPPAQVAVVRLLVANYEGPVDGRRVEDAYRQGSGLAAPPHHAFVPRLNGRVRSVGLQVHRMYRHALMLAPALDREADPGVD